MNKYELTIVMPGKSTSAKKKSTQEKLTKLVEAFKGNVGSVEDWGEKELSYEITKNETGNFLFFPLELEGSQAKLLFEKLRLEEDLIRYLLVRV